MCGSKYFVLCFIPSPMKIRFFESNVWFNAFCTLFSQSSMKTFLWIKCLVLNVLYSVLHKARWAYLSLNQNMWFKILYSFWTKFDENTFLWIKHMVEMFCALFYESNVRFEIFYSRFYTKLDEDTLLWIKCMLQNVFCSVMHKARWRCVSLNREKIVEETFLWIEKRSMKKRFFESNIWFNIIFTIFCTELDEHTFF